MGLWSLKRLKLNASCIFVNLNPINDSDGDSEFKIYHIAIIAEYRWKKVIGDGDNDDLRYNFKEIELYRRVLFLKEMETIPFLKLATYNNMYICHVYDHVR